MAESTNLMGLNLSVDNDLIASAAREAIVASVAESLKMKDRLVEEFVHSMLTEKVRVEDGNPVRFSNDKTCSRMEYVVRCGIQEALKEELCKMLDETKPLLREQIRKELAKQKTREGLVEMFMSSLSDTMRNRYAAKIDVSFSKKDNY